MVLYVTGVNKTIIENRCEKTYQIQETRYACILIANLLDLIFVVLFFAFVPQWCIYKYIFSIFRCEKTIEKMV